MTKEEFLQDIKKTYEEGLAIIVKKNADYAASSDPWRNFRFADMVGVSPERAILVRISDKLARISNLIDKEPEVVGETIDDTLVDLINYTAILRAYLKELKRKNG